MGEEWDDRASEAIIRRVAAAQGKSPEEIEAAVVRARRLVEQVRAQAKARDDETGGPGGD